MHQQQQAKTSGVTIAFDFSQPLKQFEWFKYEQKQKGYIGNLASVYHRFEKAIKANTTPQYRREIYEREKEDYIKEIENRPLSEWYTEEQYNELKRQAVEDKNIVINTRVKDKLMKDFFKWLVENGKEASEYLEIV